MVWLFAFALAVQIGYWIAIAAGLSRLDSGEEQPVEASMPVSVIIAAKDEADRLPRLLEALEVQVYPHFEVIVVDDASSDATSNLVDDLAARDPRFRTVRVEEPKHPRKKHALAAGIASASHDRLAFTDADCVPEPRWLAVIASLAEAEPEAVLVGYGPYWKERGALNALVRYETWITAVMTASATALGRPYMAVGRSFSYPQSLFERIGGFEHQMHSLSGDDDLLVQEARLHDTPVRYLLAEQAAVFTRAPSSWKVWLRQKMRHTSAGRHYDRGAKANLAAFHASNLIVWISPLFLGWTGAAFLAGRFLVQRAILKRAEDRFPIEPDLMVYHPALDLGYLIYNTFVAPAGALFGGKRW